MVEKHFIISRAGLSINVVGLSNPEPEVLLTFLEPSATRASELEDAMYEAAMLQVYTGKTVVELLEPIYDSLPEAAREFVISSMERYKPVANEYNLYALDKLPK